MTDFHTQYSERIRVQTINGEDSMTHQSFKEGQDVNHIIDRYVSTGHLPEMGSEGYYGDATAAEDYSTLMNNLIAIRTAFEALPDDVREEFQSPEDWINASLDTERLSEILERIKGDPEGSSDPSEVTVEAPQQAAESGAVDP